jgi:Protein of unknown function (DUF2924)/Resolvase, N terminal domain/Recombinase
MPSSALDREAIEAEIDRLRSLGLDELRNLWRTTLRSSPPPAFAKDLIARFLCWHIQEQARGGLDPETAKHLDGLIRGDKAGADRPRRLKPGTVLVREYQGERHTVTVIPNGYYGARRPMRACPRSRGPSPAPPGMGLAFLACVAAGSRRFHQSWRMGRRRPSGEPLVERPKPSHNWPSPHEARMGTLLLPPLPLLMVSADHESCSSKTPTLRDLLDRLTRSLADFAKLVELFDEYGVSFVSITQSFNTTSSMGRLTLNVLLSFAQFEREVIGERVRDKIAASKRKGLWVGGPVLLGYRCLDKKLEIVPDEAEVVRTIFTLYLELGSMGALAAELDRRGIKTKAKRPS